MAGLPPTPEQIDEYNQGEADRSARGDALASLTGLPSTLESYRKFSEDPSIATGTGAAVHTGMQVLKPHAALAALLMGMTAAGAKDVGASLLPSAQAQAGSDPLSPEQRRRYTNLSRRQDLTPGQTLELQTLNKIISTAADRKGGADQAEYTDAVNRANINLAAELGRQVPFGKTSVGKVWNEVGSLAPGLIGFGTGALGRAASGPGRGIGKDYVIPGIEGMLAGGLASNLPIGWDAFFSPVDNPEKTGYAAYARDLPQTHPRRAEWDEYAGKLPAENPLRKAAQKEFYDPDAIMKRVGFGAAEGLLGGLAGSAAVRLPGAVAEWGAEMPGRIANAYRRSLAGTKPFGTGTANPQGNPQGQFGDWAAYPPMGSPQRNAIRDAYRDAVLARGQPLDPSMVNKDIQSAVQQAGGTLPDVTKRVKRTNENYNDFVATHGRPPVSLKEWDDFVFKATGTLGLAGAVAGSASADDELNRLLGLY